uniref:Uncharacterized protein n=1 Tax=Glossina pallidipes TaxID=7398 RepID=A0A1A9ZPV4_GLOPL
MSPGPPEMLSQMCLHGNQPPMKEKNHIEPAGSANHNMSDQAQPKNFAAVKTQHTEQNILATAIVYIISNAFPVVFYWMRLLLPSICVGNDKGLRCGAFQPFECCEYK